MPDSTSRVYYQNGSMNFPQPFYEKGSQMMSFIFKSDSKSLQTVCDNWLNLPTNNELYYQPLLPVVMVTFANNKQSWPTTAPYDQWGVIPYQEVIFSIFVVRVKKLGDVWITEHVSTLVPYIFVNDAIVMANGREIYGMPKTFGMIQLPDSPLDPQKYFELATVSAATFKKGAPFSTLPIASIGQTSTNDIPTKNEWTDITSAAKALKNLIFGTEHIELPGLNLIIEIADLFLEKKIPFTALRQVRSISSPEEAAYKAVIEFDSRMQNLNGGGLIKGTFQLKLPQNDLFPIATDLGLTDGQLAEAAFWIDWDFLFETGNEIWTTKEKSNFWQRLTQLF